MTGFNRDYPEWSIHNAIEEQNRIALREEIGRNLEYSQTQQEGVQYLVVRQRTGSERVMRWLGTLIVLGAVAVLGLEWLEVNQPDVYNDIVSFFERINAFLFH